MTGHPSDAPPGHNGEPIVIVGAGFGGLACAKALGAAGVPVRLIDRQNYHLFVPLLYQVATAALSPADIAQPIRRILRRYPSVEVLLGDVRSVDTQARAVVLEDGGRVPYSQLILATGSVSNYFGHDEWAPHARSPRYLPDATEIRARILRALEEAERSEDPARRQALLTFVVVGGGATGVEMAGAIAELVRHSLRGEFRSIDPAQSRIVLIEAGQRLLTAFPEALADYAVASLQKLGVEVRTGSPVQSLDAHGVVIDNHRIMASTIIWGAGTRAAPAAHWLGLPDAGRLPVAPDLSVQGRPDMFALGDVALCLDGAGRPLPALAQVAKQQGEHLGRGLAKLWRDGTPLAPFRFRNRGNTAIIGRNAAIFDFGGGWLMRGRLAWLLWALVHIYLLSGMERRFLVATQWLVRYVTRQRGARLITTGEPGAGQPFGTVPAVRPIPEAVAEAARTAE
jgi:NADH dehydrogenase